MGQIGGSYCNFGYGNIGELGQIGGIHKNSGGANLIAGLGCCPVDANNNYCPINRLSQINGVRL